MNESKKKTVAIVLLVAALVVVGAVAAVAVYSSQRADNKDDAKTADSEVSNKTTNNDEQPDEKEERSVVDWTVLKADEYQMPVPDGWKLKKVNVTYTGPSGGLKSQFVTEETEENQNNLVYKAGTPASIKEVDETRQGGAGHSGHFSLLRMHYTDTNLDSLLSSFKANADSATKHTMKNGDTLHMSVKTYKKDEQLGAQKIKEGTHSYGFLIDRQGRKDGLDVHYWVEPDMTDYSSQLKKALMQLQFK